MSKGGYTIIDLQGNNLDSDNIVIPGLYNKIKQSDKAFLLSNCLIDNKWINEEFVNAEIDNNIKLYYNNYIITITADDNVSVAINPNITNVINNTNRILNIERLLINNASINLLNSFNIIEREYRGVQTTPVFLENGLLDYINLNGTATASTFIKVGDVPLKANITYVASLGVTGYSVKWDKSGVNRDTITPNEDIVEDLRIRVNLGDVFDNVKIFPMVRYGEIEETTYMPHYPNNYELYEMIKQLTPTPTPTPETINEE